MEDEKNKRWAIFWIFISTCFGWLIQTHMWLTSLMLDMVSKFELMQIYKQVWVIINLYYGSTF